MKQKTIRTEIMKETVNLEPIKEFIERDVNLSDIVNALDMVLWEFTIDKIKTGHDWSFATNDLCILQDLKQALKTCIQTPKP